MPETAVRDTESGPRSRTIYLIAMVHHALRATRLEPALKPLGVTPLQYTILTVIEAHPGLSSAQLSRRFYVTPQTMGQVLAGLASRGLLRRREDPDNRRVLLVQVTAKGRKLIDACSREIAPIEAEIFQAPETAALRDQLQHVARYLRQHSASPLADAEPAPRRRRRAAANA